MAHDISRGYGGSCGDHGSCEQSVKSHEREVSDFCKSELDISKEMKMRDL
jgi:hypothetical protein